MSEFRKLTENLSVSPQLALADVATAAASGIAVIVNNRPDGEDPNAPQGDEIGAAAAAAGLNYVEIPIGHAGFSEPQVDAMIAALEQAEGPSSRLLSLGHPFDLPVGAGRKPSKAAIQTRSPVRPSRPAMISARFAQ